MNDIKIAMDEYGYLYAVLPDCSKREILADVFNNPYYGKVKIGAEKEEPNET